jgi:hypothetical protein
VNTNLYRPTPPLSIRRINEKKTKVLTLNKYSIWPWVPAGPDARSERTDWLPAVSFCFLNIRRDSIEAGESPSSEALLSNE